MLRNQSQVTDLFGRSLATDKKTPNKQTFNIFKLLLVLSTKKLRSKYRKITITQTSHAFTNLRKKCVV